MATNTTGQQNPLNTQQTGLLSGFQQTPAQQTVTTTGTRTTNQQPTSIAPPSIGTQTPAQQTVTTTGARSTNLAYQQPPASGGLLGSGSGGVNTPVSAATSTPAASLDPNGNQTTINQWLGQQRSLSTDDIYNYMQQNNVSPAQMALALRSGTGFQGNLALQTNSGTNSITDFLRQTMHMDPSQQNAAWTGNAPGGVNSDYRGNVVRGSGQMPAGGLTTGNNTNASPVERDPRAGPVGGSTTPPPTSRGGTQPSGNVIGGGARSYTDPGTRGPEGLSGGSQHVYQWLTGSQRVTRDELTQVMRQYGLTYGEMRDVLLRSQGTDVYGNSSDSINSFLNLGPETGLEGGARNAFEWLLGSEDVTPEEIAQAKANNGWTDDDFAAAQRELDWVLNGGGTDTGGGGGGTDTGGGGGGGGTDTGGGGTDTGGGLLPNFDTGAPMTYDPYTYEALQAGNAETRDAYTYNAATDYDIERRQAMTRSAALRNLNSDGLVQERLAGLFSEPNPLMEQMAALAGQQYNARGMFNSTDATAAAMKAMAGVGLDIATTDAGTVNQISTDNQQALNLASQDNQLAINAARTDNQTAFNNESKFGAEALNTASQNNQTAINDARTDNQEAINSRTEFDVTEGNNANRYNQTEINDARRNNQTEVNNFLENNAQRRYNTWQTQLQNDTRRYEADLQASLQRAGDDIQRAQVISGFTSNMSNLWQQHQQTGIELGFADPQAEADHHTAFIEGGGNEADYVPLWVSWNNSFFDSIDEFSGTGLSLITDGID